MIFKIVNIFQQDAHLVVQVEHYNPDGTFWFLEHYRWQGREGLKRKRATNAQGEILLEDGSVAPYSDPPGELEQYLPEGAKWQYLPGPHLDESNILGTIQTIHQRRLASGWPQGRVDILARTAPHKLRQEDHDGSPQLLSKFDSLKDRIV